jgi:ATP-dependent exoDNAse (exonuclease V) alpha subunit
VGFPEEAILPRNLSLCAPQFFREKVFESVDDLQDRGIPVESMSQAGALFDFGYALTVHKSQGSQAKHVIFVVEDSARGGDEKFWRRLAYTAATRSSEKLTILI